MLNIRVGKLSCFLVVKGEEAHWCKPPEMPICNPGKQGLPMTAEKGMVGWAPEGAKLFWGCLSVAGEAT